MILLIKRYFKINIYSMEEYITLKILGRGAKGELTKKVRSKFDQKLYVMKELGQNKLTKNQKKVLNILNDDECPYIVKHYQNEDNETLIKTDFINDLDLFDYTNTHMDLEKPIEEKIIWKLLLQCLESIKYLHEHNIIHRNIRLENFYMTDDKDIKLGNFKHATIISDNNEDEDDNYPEGGMLYKNLDALNNSIYDKSSDIYSLGVVFHKMCFFQFPYEPICKNKNDNQFELKSFADNTKKNLEHYSNDLVNLIKTMLNENEEQLDINNIYEQVLNKYKNKYIKNTAIKSVFKCLSSFEGYRNSDIRKKMNAFPGIENFFYCADFCQESKDKNKYMEAINYFRKMMEDNFILKIDEEPRPFDILRIFFEKYMKDISKLDDTDTKKIIKSINRLHYGKVNVSSTLYNFGDGNLIFNFLQIKVDKCVKGININELLKQKILNSEAQNTKFRYNYIKDPEYLPEYLIIILEREKYSTDNTPMLIPKIELDNEYILVAYLNRKIEDGYEIFNSVYSIRQSNNLTWMLSEGDTIKKLETNELKNTYGTPEILFYEIKKK